MKNLFLLIQRAWTQSPCAGNGHRRGWFVWSLLITCFLLLHACGVEQTKPKVEDQSVEQSKREAAAKQKEKKLAQEREEKRKQELLEKQSEPEVEVTPVEDGEKPTLTLEPIAEEVIEKPEAQDSAKEPVPAPTTKDVKASGDQIIITVEKKNQSHPHYGEGHQMGFSVNGVQGDTLVFERGKSYQIDVSTNPKHDVYISSKAIGWGSSAWTEGIEGDYIYQGRMKFKPPKSAPKVLYYSCRNHPYMGGEIQIVNPGESVQVKTPSTRTQGVVKKQTAVVSESTVKQKLMFAQMLLNSKMAKRVKSSKNDSAIKMHNKAAKLIDVAKAKIKSADFSSAHDNIQEALGMLKKATKLVPTKEMLVEHKEQHKELLASLKNFEVSYKHSYERVLKDKGKSAVVDYDKEKVAALKSKASKLAKAGNYAEANSVLEKAQRAITTAIQKMLEKQTIVIKLPETAAEQYEYELQRFVSYEELIPVAIEMKKPAAGAIQLMESFLAKARKMRDSAVDKAKQGEYPMAIAMLEDATIQVRRALRMVGVSQ